MEVRTYDNRRVPVSEMDQQHLSNWYWYSKIVLGISEDSYNSYRIEWIVEELEERFDGVILPYRPKENFFYEIGYLFSKGHLNPITNEITYEGEVVGEYISK